jgi:hypothetical protein
MSCRSQLKGASTKIVLVAFDLLYLNGRDLRNVPLLERKAALKKIITGSDLQLSDSFEIDGREMFTHACKMGLEGVVSKVRDSIYASGRGNNWIKKTCAQRETLTIAGFALDEGKWDGIYLARRKGDHLIYAGKVDHVVLQDGEIGAAIGGRHHDFAVDDRGISLDVPSVVGDLPEAIGPVVTPPRENPHCFVSEMHLDTIAVELDFMDPSLAGRHAVDRGRQGRLDEAGEGRLDAQRSGFFPWKAIATPGED